MKPKFGKKLTLNRETVRELTDSQLDQAVGGVTVGGGSRCIDTQGCTSQSSPTCICNTQEPGGCNYC